MNQQETSRRDFLKILGAVAMASQLPEALEERRAEAQKHIEAADRVFIANEDSNTITVIDPRSNRGKRP
jgi:ferritin-like metal-binding protein YciE